LRVTLDHRILNIYNCSNTRREMNAYFVPKGQDLTQDGDPRDGQY